LFRKLLTLDEARDAINSRLSFGTLGTEEISLLDAYNRVLAESVTSTLDIPPFNRSTVDGYAVRAEDTYGAYENNLVVLKVIGTVSVGESPKLTLGKDEAAEIVTGAPIPEGANAAVMVENTERKDDRLEVSSSVTKDENVMKKGSDIKNGEKIFKAGKVLKSRETGVLAAIGKPKVKVYTIPSVAVLSTGAEVTELGHKLPPGKIYDINAYSLSTAVIENGGKPIYAGVVPDDRSKLRSALEHSLTSADMVLTSGGVSVGPKDIMPETLASLGKPGIIFSGVAVKPGKPVTVALIGKKSVFSFPGHPTSTLLMFHLLARPVLRQMAGREQSEKEVVRAFSKVRIFGAKGRRTFVMVKLMRDEKNHLIAEPVETGASGAISTLAKADGFVEIPENQQFVDACEEVAVTLLDSRN
jgi:molybdenum cofactor synthesis domain-containing protein